MTRDKVAFLIDDDIYKIKYRYEYKKAWIINHLFTVFRNHLVNDPCTDYGEMYSFLTGFNWNA